MPIRYVKYTKEQRRNTKVTGYSLYVNSSHCSVFDSIHEITKEAKKFAAFNDVEIYQILGRR